MHHDLVGLTHHLQVLAFMSLLSSYRLLALHTLALGPSAEHIARRRPAAVMAVLRQAVFQRLKACFELCNPLPQYRIFGNEVFVAGALSNCFGPIHDRAAILPPELAKDGVG